MLEKHAIVPFSRPGHPPLLYSTLEAKWPTRRHTAGIWTCKATASPSLLLQQAAAPRGRQSRPQRTARAGSGALRRLASPAAAPAAPAQCCSATSKPAASAWPGGPAGCPRTVPMATRWMRRMHLRLWTCCCCRTAPSCVSCRPALTRPSASCAASPVRAHDHHYAAVHAARLQM